MADQVIPQGAPAGKDWEERLYQEGCIRLQEEAAHLLRRLDDWLLERSPLGWKVVGLRKRTVVCRFGAVTISRRLYQDGEGNYHFLLDEYLEWDGYQAATPSVGRAAVRLAAVTSFREAADILEDVTAGVLSRTTIHQLVQKTAAKAMVQEREDVESCYGRGEVPPKGERAVPRLFLEADGLYVRLQREKRKHREIRMAIGYEGWERLPQTKERYQLVGKRVYCQGSERIDFWEGTVLAFGRQWDWSQIPQVVLNGDGAKWIDEGVEPFEGGIRQLDGFHLARSCYHAGGEAGPELYEAMRRGDWKQAREILSKVTPSRKEGRARAWVEKVIREERGADWRVQAGVEKEEGRGMGTMEGNGAQILARRMKGKGMSWTERGAGAMAKVRELLTNGELNQWCGRQAARSPVEKPSVAVRATAREKRNQGEWLQAGVPSLYGPHASRPWARILRQMFHPYTY